MSEREAVERAAMLAAIDAAARVRRQCSPNPWVGAAVLDRSGTLLATGATEPPGGRHAEVVALDAAGDVAGGTVVSTLEPCCHVGRTGPCTDRIIASGVRRVVVGVLDPDPRVSGQGVAALRAAGVEVEVGVMAREVSRQLAPYLHHRATGRPYVVYKAATTLDGATAAPDGTSQWITGETARRDAHRLRAESDAILVGAGTVRADDPSLTVRHVEGRNPLRVVLGSAPAGARVHPCLEWTGDVPSLLDELGRRGIVQLLVEGGAHVAGSFHDLGLIDRYVVYIGPALVGGPGGLPAIAGHAATTIDGLWRGHLDVVERVGDDVRLEVVPSSINGLASASDRGKESA